ncbi:MAG: hypothetical protein HFI86_02905 [Bacilli bacterium]|nr:hypothetical protein [Bacilli bacterium]
MLKLQNKLFIINYNACDLNYIDDFLKYLNDNASRIMRFFNLDCLPEKITINIIENKPKFDEIYFSQYKEQAYDFAFGFAENNTINYISFCEFNNVPKHLNDTYDYYKKTIVHEFVHICNQVFSKFFVPCLSEGLAVYLSGQLDNINIKFNYTKEKLINGRINYRQYYLFVKYIIENYNHEFVLNLYKSEEFFYENFDKLYDEVRNYYESYN